MPLYSRAFAMSATGIAPSRPIRQVSPFNSTMVEASVPPVSPVSSTSGTRRPSCFITCSAFEHDGNPEMFALVPVTGPSNSSIRRRTTVLFGQRNAMRPVPAVTLRGMRCAAFTTSVSPPGQNACASRRNFRGASRASRMACSSFPREQNGLFDGIHEDGQCSCLLPPLHTIDFIHRG